MCIRNVSCNCSRAMGSKVSAPNIPIHTEVMELEQPLDDLQIDCGKFLSIVCAIVLYGEGL